jgi:cell wall-associated NlpC family hydrolase
MSHARRTLIAVGTALSLGLVLAAAPADAATKPATPTTVSATKKPSTKKTTAVVAKTATTKKTTTTSKTAAAKKATATKTANTKTANTKAANAKTVTAKKVMSSAITTTTAAVKVRPSTAVNVDGIRSAAIAALAARGRAGEPAAQARLAGAVAVAAHTATPASLVQAWAHTTPARLVAVYTALAQVGAPYQSLGMAPSGFDCSGLTWFAWHAAGVSLPRSSAAQRLGLRAAADFAHALPGDIIWYPGHVELYLGAGRAMVHAKQRGDVVQVDDATRAVQIKIPVS